MDLKYIGQAGRAFRSGSAVSNARSRWYTASPLTPTNRRPRSLAMDKVVSITVEEGTDLDELDDRGYLSPLLHQQPVARIKLSGCWRQKSNIRTQSRFCHKAQILLIIAEM